MSAVLNIPASLAKATTAEVTIKYFILGNPEIFKNLKVFYFVICSERAQL
jgi:hypothetical protein